MRIHHLNCASFCPFGGHLIDGLTPGFGHAKLVCHTLLIESEQGLILIDTGLGWNDIKHHRERLPPFSKKILRPLLLKQETALYQVISLGFRPEDVRHIIVTHLDFDHAGGIDDFPNAEVHLMHAERTAAMESKTRLAKRRYSPPQLKQARHWNTYFPEGERWFGFQSVTDLEGLPPEILLVPLPGHSAGHTGVAIHTNRGWLLHAGDAYYYRGELDIHYQCPSLVRFNEKMLADNNKQRLMNLDRLRQLAHKHPNEVTIFSAHDAVEYLSLKEGVPHHMISKQFKVIDDNDLAGLGLS